ncbi:hypothetical protein F5Y11DRAFT_340083 [Daldinia sp. FL1419]|nr:hypothetical protein F5Y11DRAFT_340083 [Daldinia sp. FL1419]
MSKHDKDDYQEHIPGQTPYPLPPRGNGRPYYHPDVLSRLHEPLHIDPKRPPSPYAQRYGISEIPHYRHWKRDGKAHSSLSVEPPYDRPKTDKKPVKKPTNEALNNLFRTEKDQIRWSNPSVRTWRLASVNNGLSGGWPSGWNADLNNWSKWDKVQSKFVQPNENTWFTCFRKDRWFDARYNPLNALSHPIPNFSLWPQPTWYSVDNPVIWHYTSRAIEVANRILRLLCQEQNEWLDALMFTYPIPIGHNASYDFPDDARPYKTKLFPRPREQRATGLQIYGAIESLTKGNIVNTFCDETSLAHPAQAVTTRYRVSASRAMIMFNVSYALRPLLERETSVQERCIHISNFASLILHEFMHALWMCRFKVPNVPDDEPFFNKEWIAELGHSFTKQIWGGTIQPGPTRQYIRGRHRGFATCIQLDTFPGPGYAERDRDYDHNYFRAYANGDMHGYHFFVPATWSSSIMSEHFWDHIIPKRGSIALRVPLLFGMAASYGNTNECRMLDNPEFWVPELKAECESAMLRWRTIGDRIKYLRHDWYDPAFAEWKQSHWSDTWFLHVVETFIHAHANRNLYKCREELSRLLQSSTPESNTLISPNQSIPYLLSLLMYLSLPRYPEGRITKNQLQRSAYYYPSLRATPWHTKMGLGYYFGPLDVLSNTSQESVEDIDIGYKFYHENMMAFVDAFYYVEREIGAEREWLSGILENYLELNRERTADPRWEAWGSFSFKIPKYNPNWVVANQSNLVLSAPIHHRFGNLVPWTSGRTPQPTWSPPPSPHTMDSQWKKFKMHPSHAAKILPTVPIYPPHVGVGIVANHRTLDDAWVVEPDGSDGFDIFDITDELEARGATEDDYRAIITLGPEGPTLNRDERANIIREGLRTRIKRIGKLATRRLVEEIAEYNGQNGQPAWTMFGLLVFDITNFPARSPHEADELRKSAGQRLSIELTRTDSEMKDILERLDPYVCAYVRPPPLPRNLRVFTPTMLRWYDNPSLGVYIALKGAVYDISEYCLHHPGGSVCFNGHTGLDATQEFLRFHDPDILEACEYMKVGYLVPEYTWDQLHERHVVIHDWVFDISSLQTQDVDLFNTLQKFTRKDTSVDVAGENADAGALVKLFLENQEWIVGRMVNRALLDIPWGEFVKHNNANGPRDAWVSVEGYVYSVAGLMKFPTFYTHHLGHGWAGKYLTNPSLARWLTANFEARCIGRIIQGPIPPDPDMGTYPVGPPTSIYAPRLKEDLIIERRHDVVLDMD